MERDGRAEYGSADLVPEVSHMAVTEYISGIAVAFGGMDSAGRPTASLFFFDIDDGWTRRLCPAVPPRSPAPDTHDALA